jgi:enoyl reductase-like protein
MRPMAFSHAFLLNLQDMTYAEVLHRMVKLMFTNDHWLHQSYCSRTYLFLLRTEQRFSKQSVINAEFSSSILERTPFEILQLFVKKYPSSEKQLVSTEDVDYFIHLCKEGGKPVNFIPIIDKGNRLFAYVSRGALI